MASQDFYVIVFTPLFMTAAIIAVGAARIAHKPEKRSEYCHVHGSCVLLLSFLVLPATSMKVRTGLFIYGCIAHDL